MRDIRCNYNCFEIFILVSMDSSVQNLRGITVCSVLGKISLRGVCGECVCKSFPKTSDNLFLVFKSTVPPFFAI